MAATDGERGHGKKLLEADDFTAPAFLVDHGVPWHIAHDLDADHRLAYVIFYTEREGGLVWEWHDHPQPDGPLGEFRKRGENE